MHSRVPRINRVGSRQNSDAPWTSPRSRKREKAEVLAAFAAHKDEVTAGYAAAAKRG